MIEKLFPFFDLHKTVNSKSIKYQVIEVVNEQGHERLYTYESATATLIGNYYILSENRRNYSKIVGIISKDKVEEADREAEKITEKFLKIRSNLKLLRFFEEWEMLGKRGTRTSTSSRID